MWKSSLFRFRRYRLYLLVLTLFGFFYWQLKDYDHPSKISASSSTFPLPPDSRPGHNPSKQPNTPPVNEQIPPPALHDGFSQPKHEPASQPPAIDSSVVKQTPSSDVVDNPLKYFEVLGSSGGASRSANGNPQGILLGEAHLPRQPKFPLSAENLIQLPKPKLKERPRVQASQFKETDHEKTVRLQRKDYVSQVFRTSWDQYKKYAWGYDELKPLTNEAFDPFLGWAATIVDAMDTLQIMGLDDEFQQTVKFVENIHFNTTYRKVIPMFETTIRYLGGLLSSYDLSGGKEKGLLRQAVNLGELLIGAFDTPNHMPLTYFKWEDDFQRVKYRADQGALTAEIGSFTVEFTRLSQLSGDPKYYDAVARITEKIYEFLPKSTIPWVLPQTLDVSGCKSAEHLGKVNVPFQPVSGLGKTLKIKENVPKAHDDEKTLPDSVPTSPVVGGPGPARANDAIMIDAGKEKLRAINKEENNTLAVSIKDQNLDSSTASYGSFESDAQMLADAAGEAFADDDPTHKKKVSEAELTATDRAKLKTNIPEGIREDPAALALHHAAVDDMTADEQAAMALEVAAAGIGQSAIKKRAPVEPDLTDFKNKILIEKASASVWPVYSCEPVDTIRPGLGKGAQVFTLGSMSDSAFEYFMKEYQLLAGGEEKYTTMYTKLVSAIKEHFLYRPLVENNEDILFLAGKTIQPSGLETMNDEMSHLVCYVGGMLALGGRLLDRPEDVDLAAKVTQGCVWAYNSTRTGVMPETFLTRRCPGTYDSKEPCVFDFEKELVAARQSAQDGKPNTMPTSPLIEDNEFPGKMRWNVKGAYDMPRSYLSLRPSYIMRPEALESVFYMYRITGDKVWQERGWQMFKSIAEATKIVKDGQIVGYTSVADVTMNTQAKAVSNNAESFWWGETLKYAYLLFEEPDKVSLDDYVFNTEAHPFKLDY